MFKINLLEGKKASMRELINLIVSYFFPLFLKLFSLFLFEIVRLGYVLLPLGSFPTSTPLLNFLQAFSR